MTQPGEDAKSLGLRGLSAYQAGRMSESIELTTRALSLDASIPALHSNLSAALNAVGRFADAAGVCENALRAWPVDPFLLLNLGNALLGNRQFDDAVAIYRRTLALAPNQFQALNNLGHALRQLRRTDEAIDVLRQAVAVAPQVPEAHANLANALKDQARLEEAIACYRQAVRLAPERAQFASNLLYAQSFDSNLSPKELYDAHTNWGVHYADGLRDARPFENARDASRKLRIGYVSADFRNQVLGLFVEPLLKHHDRSKFEIVCYSDVVAPDEATARMQALANAWRDTRVLSDAELAELVRQDRIDILVDMSNHMGDNRLPVFARKPAPVQITFPHPFTTGMKAMDYVVTDVHLDPPAKTPMHRERLLRMPETYLCYPEPVDSPPVAPAPMLASGHPTFVFANNFCKLNASVLRTWSRILTSIADARLIVRLDGGATHNAPVPRWFADHGIDPARVAFQDVLPRDAYLRFFDRADVCLDPFPYAGYTTSLDAIWMGVPLVTLAGETALSRLGVSILSNLGLQELIARSTDEYVSIATSLARDPDRLSSLRAGMRDRMRQPPLLAHERFARQVESAYRDAWERWCDERTVG